MGDGCWESGFIFIKEIIKAAQIQLAGGIKFMSARSMGDGVLGVE